jgi:hypothetical protein
MRLHDSIRILPRDYWTTMGDLLMFWGGHEGIRYFDNVGHLLDMR